MHCWQSPTVPMQKPHIYCHIPCFATTRSKRRLFAAIALDHNQQASSACFALASVSTGCTRMQMLQQEMRKQASALPAPCSAVKLGTAACTCGMALANSVREVRSTCAGPYNSMLH